MSRREWLLLFSVVDNAIYRLQVNDRAKGKMRKSDNPAAVRAYWKTLKKYEKARALLLQIEPPKRSEK